MGTASSGTASVTTASCRTTALLWCVVLAAGCAGAPPPPPALLSSTELLAWVPGGAEWVLVLRPAALQRSPGARRMADTIFGASRVAGWLSSGALDAHGRAIVPELPFLALARYPDGLVLVVPRQSGTQPFGRDGPDLAVRGGRFVVAARVAGRPAAFDTLVAALGATDAARQPAHADPELLGAADAGDDPITVLFPQPLGLPLGSAVGVLLAHQRTMRVGVAGPAEGQVTLRVSLHGEFPPGAEDNIRRLITVLAADSLGQAFGGPGAISDLLVVRRDGELFIKIDMLDDSFARGVTLLFGDPRRLIGLPM